MYKRQGIDNTSIKDAKNERIDKQYYVASSPVHEEVITLIRTAESFNAELLDAIERLNREKTDIFRKKCVKFF